MAAPGLDELTQADWSGGMCRAVARHLIPGDAAWDIRDGLLDDDGAVYQRGPTTRLTSNQLGAAIFGLWEGSFSPGRRLVGGGATSFGWMAPGDVAWRVAGGGPAFGLGGGLAPQLGEIMFMPGAGVVLTYAGSLKLAGTSVGTANFTNGSKVVTGVGTSWLTSLDVGMFIYRPGVPPFTGVVASVDTNTQVTLVDAWQGATIAGTAFFAAPIATYPLTPTPGAQGAVAVVGGRVAYAVGRKVLLTKTIDPNTGQPRLWEHDVNDYHEFPGDVVALATLRDRVFVFTKAGIYSISNAALEIVDAFGNPQHRVEKVSGDVILRSIGGVAPWRDSLVIAAVGGVYVVDAGGGLELVSRAISPLWQSLMSTGQVVYQIATFRDHVFIPVGGQVLVGRLDRRTKTPVGVSAPWTRFSQGDGSAVSALAVQDPYGSPKLVGGSPSISGGFLLDLTGVFGTGALPAAVGGNLDSNAGPVGMVVETREYVVDAGAVATVRDVALEYESTDGQLAVSAAVGQRATPTADPTYTALASSAAGNYATQNPRVLGVRREARRVSFTIASSGGVTGWRLRAVRLRSRLRGRRR